MTASKAYLEAIKRHVNPELPPISPQQDANNSIKEIRILQLSREAGGRIHFDVQRESLYRFISKHI